MRFEINDKYAVRTDPYNFILVEKLVSKTDRIFMERIIPKGTTTEKDVAFFSTIPSLINGLIEREIKRSELTGLTELKEYVESILSLISSAIAGVTLKAVSELDSEVKGLKMRLNPNRINKKEDTEEDILEEVS